MGRLSTQEYNRRKALFDQGLGWCTSCKTAKPLDQFYKLKGTTFGYRLHCISCHSIEAGTERVKKRNRNRARALTKYYVELAGDKCQKCGYDKSAGAMDFHHIDRATKQYTPTEVITRGNHEHIIEELDKCILLCANCHREYTTGGWTAEFVKRDGLGWTIEEGTVSESDPYAELPEHHVYSQASLI